MVRVTNYFDTQIRLPVGQPEKTPQMPTSETKGNSSAPATTSAFQAHLRQGMLGSKPMSIDQLTGSYGKILEGVKQRYRKLQRLARSAPLLLVAATSFDRFILQGSNAAVQQFC